MSQDGTKAVLRVYWRRGCGFCRRLRRNLDRQGISYEAIDIWHDPEAAAFLRTVTGGDETVPTVVIGEQVLVNPTPQELLAILSIEAPLVASGAHERRRWWSR